MSLLRDVLEIFGIHRMPWVTRAFMFLIFVFLGVLVFAASELPQGAPDDHPMRELFQWTADALKLMVGAFLGALVQSAESLNKPQA